MALILMSSFIVPTTFLMAPPRAQAFPVNVITDFSTTSLGKLLKAGYTLIKETLIEIHTYTSMVAEVAQFVNTYILEPLLFILSGKLIKALTSAVIQYVIGKANGTGIPQFVVDVQKSIRTVQDSQELAYLQGLSSTGSPFASSIGYALNDNYLKHSSLAGYWADNMCTLARSSPTYTPAFLSGDWSKGGVAAWFALTTEDQNNPYMLYQNSEQNLRTFIGPGVGGASGTRLAQLNWGQGFLSWCGPFDPEAAASNQSSYSGASGQSSTIVANPGDPCITSDNTPGTIRTPGSVIKATLDKVLGAQQDQVVGWGDIAPEVNGILGNIGTVMKTFQLASSILGGNDSGGISSSGGLLGIDNSSGSGQSFLSQFAQSDTFGITESQINQNAIDAQNSASSSLTAADQSKLSAIYVAAWGTIGASAQTASSSVSALAVFCTNAANTAARQEYQNQNGALQQPTQAQLDAIHTQFIDAARTQVTEAHAAISVEITPVLTQAAAAPTFSPVTDAMAAQAQFDAESVGGGATTSPSNLLNISRPSPAPLVDQMKLLSTNAAELKILVCTQPGSVN